MTGLVSRAFGALLVRFESSSVHLLRELAMKEGCGLLADGQTCQSNNHSGIRHDCCVPFRCCRLLVVLTEGHDLCPPEDQGEVSLNFVRSRNKVVRSLATGLACTPERVECRPAVMAWPLIRMRRVTPLDSLTNSGRGEDTRKGAGTLAFEMPSGAFRIVVTWLILPVVICLSQRLSHACLSINKFVL